MNHAQNVWLAHSMTFSVAFWIYCQYYSAKKNKARRRANAKRTQEKLFTELLYHESEECDRTCYQRSANVDRL